VAIGFKTVAKLIRTILPTSKRLSATIKNKAKALSNSNFDNEVGPCLKKGGGVLSSEP
jgi:hypothetical protein